ncbi:hypothetical protein [Actinophytocola sediminis]
MAMIWATVAEVRAHCEAQTSAWGVDEWPALPEDDPAVQAMIDTATRALIPKVIRWPILGDDDRAEDEEQRGHLVVAVCEVIRDRLRAKAVAAAVGGQVAVDVVAAGGRIKASQLEVQGGSGSGGSSGWTARRARLPLEAYDALSAAGLIGGSVPSW